VQHQRGLTEVPLDMRRHRGDERVVTDDELGRSGFSVVEDRDAGG
jgi:hypothetical protein